MSVSFVLPTLLGVALIGLMGRVDWQLRPAATIRLLTGAIMIASTGIVLIISSIAAGFVLGPARSAAVVSWCRSIPIHHEVSPFVGVTSLLLLGLIGFRCGRILLARRRAVVSRKKSGRIAIVSTDACFAYAVPTRAGCVVASTGLMAQLSPSERRAVFAHERAHLRLGHHRYLLAVELGRAVLPFLAPMVSQVHHATERAADEAAVEAVKGERQVVASAIASAVLGEPIGSLPALGAGSVTRRVEALLWPDREPRATRLRASLAMLAGVGGLSALMVQLHHFSTLFEHLCSSVS